MLKKNRFVVLALALFFIFVNSPVIAKADVQKSYSVESTNNVTVKAKISNANSFDGQVYFFIKDSKGMKRVFVLDKDDNYSKTYELPTGKSEIIGITVYDKDKNSISMPYTYDGSLNTTTDQAAVFNINLDNGNAATENSEQDKESSEDENTNTNDINQTAQQENQADEQKNADENNNNQKSSASSPMSNKTIINIVIDGTLLIVVGGMFLYLKRKEKKKNKEN